MSGHKKEVYVAFSGGGAKAIIHVGALSYIEKSYKISGVSGTSAGAAIAAMKDAGFTAKDIFHPSKSTQGGMGGESRLFDRIKKRNKDVLYLSDLLGDGGFNSLTRAQGNFFLFAALNIKNSEKFFIFFLFVLSSILTGIFGTFLHSNTYPFLSSVASGILLAFLAIFIAAWWAMPYMLRSINSSIVNGIATTERAVSEICHEIGVKLNITNRPVEMGDFRIPLFIVATDISGKRAIIYSSAGTPRVTLHDALSSSICIPAAFPVHKVGGIKHVDGGIVSNLPAFVFSEELSLFPQRRVIALRIVEETVKTTPRVHNGRFSIKRRYASAVSEALSLGADLISTVFTGTQDLAHDRMNIVQATLPTPLKVLDFKLSSEDAAAAFEQGEIAAKTLILKAFTAEEIYNAACRNIAEEVKSFLERLSLSVRKSGDLVRVAMAFQASEGGPALVLPYSYGFEGKSDWNMPIPITGSVCGEAWKMQSALVNMNSTKINSSLVHYPHIRSRLDKNIQWILSVPIIRRGTGATAFVINIDSNTKLKDYAATSPSASDEVLRVLEEIAGMATLVGEATLESIDEFNAG